MVILSGEPIGHPVAVDALKQNHPVFPATAHAAMGLEPSGEVRSEVVVQIGIEAFDKGHFLAFAGFFVPGNVEQARAISRFRFLGIGGQIRPFAAHRLMQSSQGLQPSEFAHAITAFAHAAKIVPTFGAWTCRPSPAHSPLQSPPCWPPSGKPLGNGRGTDG